MVPKPHPNPCRRHHPHRTFCCQARLLHLTAKSSGIMSDGAEPHPNPCRRHHPHRTFCCQARLLHLTAKSSLSYPVIRTQLVGLVPDVAQRRLRPDQSSQHKPLIQLGFGTIRHNPPEKLVILAFPSRSHDCRGSTGHFRKTVILGHGLEDEICPVISNGTADDFSL